jgi:hypothetical protein
LWNLNSLEPLTILDQEEMVFNIYTNETKLRSGSKTSSS